MNRALWAALGLIAGVLIAPSDFDLAAQDEQLPLAPGDTITLHYDRDVSCRVSTVRGYFVRCETSDKKLIWWNLRTVVRVENTVIR